ncbi:MerR family transcriptional regulator [Ancylobacter dichloromethanicus]
MDFTSYEAERTADLSTAPSGESDFFTIGDLAREFGVTLRALRFYEDKGLLAPRREGLTRLYSPAERSRLAIILKGKKLGFTLAEIKAMVALREGGAMPAGGLALTKEKNVPSSSACWSSRRSRSRKPSASCARWWPPSPPAALPDRPAFSPARWQIPAAPSRAPSSFVDPAFPRRDLCSSVRDAAGTLRRGRSPAAGRLAVAQSPLRRVPRCPA